MPQRAGEMEREQSNQDLPGHEMVQPGERGQKEIGDHTDDRRADQVEVEPGMHGARQPLERGVLLRRRGHAIETTQRQARSMAMRMRIPTAIWIGAQLALVSVGRPPCADRKRSVMLSPITN
jgi:hypothetical protein